MLWLKNKVRRSEFLRRNEFLWNVLRRMYRFVKYCLARLFGRLKEGERDLLYVDPHAVAHVVSRDDETMSERNSRGQPVHEHGSVYAILKRRIEEKAAYEQIPEFSQNVERIQGGAPIEGCTTEKEYLDRWRELEHLYWRIEQNGYKTQVELQTGDLSDEIKVQIGRQGELLLERGLPRLIIAQLLNLDQIPVIVTRRDQEWDRLRQDIVKIVVQRGFFHQPFNHPDLDMIPHFYGRHRAGTATYGNERWDYIVNSLPVAKGTVLDIGSYFGYFAHRFEELGFECYAVEPDKENLAVLKRYRRMMSKTFTVWEESIFDIEHFEFDIILALNIFHHLIKTRHDYEQLVAFLGKIRCKAMYFEPQQVLKDTYKSFTDEEFVNFVIDNSVLSYSRRLGRAKEKRDVYLLTA